MPLFKNGAKTDLTNNRPISLLPQISKVLQSCNWCIYLSKKGFRYSRPWDTYKNNDYGERGVANDWIKSYISNEEGSNL